MLTKNFFQTYFLIVTVFCWARVSECLFEDQAGTYDWRQQYVGRPTFSHFDQNMGKVFLATDQNLLAAINSKNGNIG